MEKLLKTLKRVISKILQYCGINKYSERIIIDQNLDMPIPDETFFCKDNLGGNLFFKDLREIYDQKKNDDLIKLLKRRLDSILIAQVKMNPTESPFPLAIMSCIGIETLGQLSVKDSDKPYKQFVDTLIKFDTLFGRSLTPSFDDAMKKMWNFSDSVLTIDSFAKLIYTYFRNSMIHGYHGKGIFLSNEDTTSFLIKDEGFLIINPGWLWDKFNEIYDQVFATIVTNKASNERRNCLKYIKKLLDK